MAHSERKRAQLLMGQMEVMVAVHPGEKPGQSESNRKIQQQEFRLRAGSCESQNNGMNVHPDSGSLEAPGLS